MSSTIAEKSSLPSLEDARKWAELVPDGAISVHSDGSTLVLRASHRLQERFEELLAAQKAGTIAEAENREYEAICQLDDVISWLNRSIRGLRSS